MAPFNFDATVFKPSYFPSSDVTFEPGRFWSTMRLGPHVFGVKLENHGDTDAPALDLCIFSVVPPDPAAAGAVADEVRWRFDLDADLTGFSTLAAGDPLLGPAVERRRGMRLNAFQSLYEFLVITVVLQNATVRRSVQMMENLFSGFGGRAAFDGRELSCFWEPARLAAAPEEELRALKVGYRAKTLLRQAAAFRGGGLDERELRCLGKDELEGRLLKVFGVGPASVGYLLFAVFHHYDAFDTVPPWEQKIYSQLLFEADLVPAATILAEVRRRWGPWRMLAAHYVFEDLFGRHRQEPIPWLGKLLRL